jgi:cryptochrome
VELTLFLLQVLSPYLKFGALSPAKFYHTLDGIVRGKAHTEPPVSLHGQVLLPASYYSCTLLDGKFSHSAQLLWREFFYLCSARTPNFDKMEVTLSACDCMQ